MSTGRPCSNAHLRQGILLSVDFVKTVEYETGTVHFDVSGSVGGSCVRLNGQVTEMTILFHLVDALLPCQVQALRKLGGLLRYLVGLILI